MSWVFVLISVMLAPPGASAPECAGCHPSEASAHAASRHRIAWNNPLFRNEYDPRPKAWCVSCHAPLLTEAERLAPEKLAPDRAHRGVGCRACHGEPGQMISRSRSEFSIHATRVDPEFGRTKTCAGCHEFNFPVLSPDGGALIEYTNEPMQKTVSETAGLESCEGCHDPHRAAGSHDVSKVAEAIDVDLCLTSKGAIATLSIANVGAAHNVPSGGVHRYMSARLWRSSAPAKMIALRLGREFRAEADSRTTVVDTTIAPGQTRVLRAPLAALGGTPSEPVNAEVRYHYALSDDAELHDGSPANKTVIRIRRTPEILDTCPSN